MAKILVVDDDASILEWLATSLADAGHEVASASDVDQALSSVRASAPDLISADFSMPGGGGVQLLKSLRAQAAGARIPVIMITGHSPARVLEDIPADPLVSFIEKPVKIEQILQLIAELLGPQ